MHARDGFENKGVTLSMAIDTAEAPKNTFGLFLAYEGWLVPCIEEGISLVGKAIYRNIFVRSDKVYGDGLRR